MTAAAEVGAAALGAAVLETPALAGLVVVTPVPAASEKAGGIQKSRRRGVSGPALGAPAPATRPAARDAGASEGAEAALAFSSQEQQQSRGNAEVGSLPWSLRCVGSVGSVDAYPVLSVGCLVTALGCCSDFRSLQGESSCVLGCGTISEGSRFHPHAGLCHWDDAGGLRWENEQHVLRSQMLASAVHRPSLSRSCCL